LTASGFAAIDEAVKRLQLARVRICQRCGRGRAELEGADGTSLTVPLDAVRAHELERHGQADDVPWLSAVLVALLEAGGGTMREVVLDTDTSGLRALLSIARGEDTEVVACTAQEGVGLAARSGVPLYATTEALADTGQPTDDDGHERLH
jgi:hypothetical protein